MVCMCYKEEPLNLCLYLQHKCSIPPRNQLLKKTGCLAAASRYLLSGPWEHQEVHPLSVGPGDQFLSLSLGPPFLNYVVLVPTTSLSSSLSPALSPGWISDLRYSFVSDLVSCYPWLDCLDTLWTWFITSAHLGLSVDPAISPWFRSTSSGAAELCPHWWRCCPACAMVTPDLSCLVEHLALAVSDNFLLSSSLCHCHL